MCVQKTKLVSLIVMREEASILPNVMEFIDNISKSILHPFLVLLNLRVYRTSDIKENIF